MKNLNEKELIAEAKRRGFFGNISEISIKEGDHIFPKGTFVDAGIHTVFSEYDFFKNTGTLDFHGVPIYQNGVWSEVVVKPACKRNGSRIIVWNLR